MHYTLRRFASKAVGFVLGTSFVHVLCMKYSSALSNFASVRLPLAISKVTGVRRYTFYFQVYDRSAVVDLIR